MDFKGPMGVGYIHYNFAKPTKFDVEAEKERIRQSAVERPNKAASEYEVRYRSYASYLARHMHGKVIAERDNLVDAAGQLVGLSFITASNSRYLGRFEREHSESELEDTPFSTPRMTSAVGYETRYQTFKKAMDDKLPGQTFADIATPIAKQLRMSLASLYNTKYKGRYDKEKKNA